MNHIKSFFFLFLYCLPLLWRNLYFNPNCLPVVMIKAWLDDLHYKCHRAFGLALMNHRLCVQSPLTCVLFLPWLMNTPPEKKASRSSSGHRFTFPIRAASKRGKAGTLRVLVFPWDEGISLELLSYLPVSWMQHKSLVGKKCWLRLPSLGFGHGFEYFPRLELAVAIQELHLCLGNKYS